MPSKSTPKTKQDNLILILLVVAIASFLAFVYASPFGATAYGPGRLWTCGTTSLPSTCTSPQIFLTDADAASALNYPVYGTVFSNYVDTSDPYVFMCSSSSNLATSSNCTLVFTNSLNQWIGVYQRDQVIGLYNLIALAVSIMSVLMMAYLLLHRT